MGAWASPDLIKGQEAAVGRMMVRVGNVRSARLRIEERLEWMRSNDPTGVMPGYQATGHTATQSWTLYW